MASIQPRGPAAFQLRVKHALLPNAFIHTFRTEVEARTYGDHLEELLRRGIVPGELLQRPERKRAGDPLLVEVIRDYSKKGSPSKTGSALLDVLMVEVNGVRVSALTSAWADEWILMLKVQKNLVPGTVRKHVGALKSVIDWYFNQIESSGQPRPHNPLASLPRGYSRYTSRDAQLLATQPGKCVKIDTVRDRRLHPGESTAILEAIRGRKRDDRERPLPGDAFLELMFELLVNAGLRLYEAYRQEISGIDLEQRIINVNGSKGHHGALKPRIVPISTAMANMLRPYCEGREGLLFPYWDGTEEDRERCSSRLSKRFKTAFEYAGIHDLNAHDLRHEAACRFVQMRRGGRGRSTKPRSVASWGGALLP